MQNGNFMVSRSNIGEDVIFRAVISNPKISTHTLDSLLEELTLLFSEVVRGLPSEHSF